MAAWSLDDNGKAMDRINHGERMLGSSDLFSLLSEPAKYIDQQGSVENLKPGICKSEIGNTIGTEASKLGIKGPWITKSYLEMILESKDSSSRSNIQLAPLSDSYDLDRGLLLSVQAIQALLENKGYPVIVGIGGPSGSGKTSLAQKMANIIGCEVVSLESYYKPEQVRDYKYDDYSSLDIALLTKVVSYQIPSLGMNATGMLTIDAMV
ncbi:hypothetical protein BAE44_0014918 [Dichanthelium oligosanthes]|uniref:Phosphoribulokinase/uridine kinase domain-containing protein n=1 Tax=Dichanthelium oligosanthes TaxID=888268 RepID=A0A1E5VG07_9POAL|nr:hypothetical protein BAE44_0014918 [Dichanthelium oligosanthes]